MLSAPWAKGLARTLARAGDGLLDPTILFSFDQTGFVRHRVGFNPADTAVDMTGRTCLVTGANSGLGEATARALAERGATVGLLCRNPERAEAARIRIIDSTGNPTVFCATVDLSCPDSIRDAAAALPVDSIDVLVNNAGVLLNARSEAASGLETTLATNLIGPLALTAALLPKLRKGTNARVIWVSSGGMYSRKLDLGDLESPPEPFDGVRAYAQTKRAMVVLSGQLAAALEPDNIAVHCMHPGWAHTPGVERSLPAFFRVTKPILRTAETGADTAVWLSVCDRAHGQSGRFWFDRRERPTHLLPGTKASADTEERLWTMAHKWANLPTATWTNNHD